MYTSVKMGSPVIKAWTEDLDELHYSLQSRCCGMIEKILPCLSGHLGRRGCDFFG